ncbi:uncharacterized protein LOC133842353 [Drosophila sulfurigaster albostrigata]|uniref:Uncharacterized protein LOC117569574 n=1 Tax=Drosophila albomicans TaxID=7291 RepID=A0A6P8WYI0_DROAB|nr:uncharacterized protein LOC117569574 [Drosophila albomicans]XP_062131389.1 uncharacterized protein LOC133842353 [Drosophila sulfurigaster albostrigata]
MFSCRLTHFDVHLCNRNIYNARRQLHRRDNSKTEQIAKITRGLAQKHSEPNPEYHHAPRSYVENYIKHHLRNGFTEPTMFHRNPRYRWIDFRRRMVYGTYDI